MKKAELLAPAGSFESIIAAINKGADAIYLGGDKFSARAYASNFDRSTMEKAIDYAHSYGVPVYVTINTLIKENEFNEAIDYIGFLYKIGVDAIIMQDIGLLNKVRIVYPKLEIHASTQMSIHNAQGAQFFNENGFKRIVLSREMSLEEIKYISKDLGIETEIFVHGALCVSYSGQCLMSSVIGGRSGNRGKCAQGCRLPYTLTRQSDNKQVSGYLLSPKDICTIENVKDILETGTASLKVEGRMKKPEYVAGVIQSYRASIDEVLDNKKNNSTDRKKVLLQLFNREGFSNAYLYKNNGKDMMAYKTPKNTGVYLGKVGKNSEIILEQDIMVRDGIRIGEDGFTLSKIILNGKEVESAHAGDSIVMYPKKYKKADVCYKMSDTNLLNTLKKSYEKLYDKKIALTANIKFKVGMPLEIQIEYNGKRYIKSGDIVEIAQSSPLDMLRVEKNLKKSGEIPFKIESVIFEDFEDGFMPMSSINNLRRDILDEISNHEIQKYKKSINHVDFKENEQLEKEIESVLVKVTTQEQLDAAIDVNAPAIAINIFGKNKNTLKKSVFNNLERYNGSIYFETPNIIKSEFETVCKLIDSVKDKLTGIVTGNMGIVNKYKDSGLKLIGGYKLNIFNGEALKFNNKILDSTCISIELNRKEIKSLLEKENKGAQFFIYGKPEVMINEYCPIGSTFGGRNSKKECNSACVNDTFKLTDRVSENFTVGTDIFCRSYIYNPVPINLTSELKDIKSLGIKSFRIDLIDENYDDSKEIIKAVMDEKSLKLEKFTKGQYRRGVE
ncbi:MAG: DUF3656 domain-containing U32 family peptidase [Sarcina sp.]